jgi:hypothetical protein
MDTATKATLWICGLVLSLFGLATMPPEPTPPAQASPTPTTWAAYEYGEIPATANEAVEAYSRPVDATKPPAPTTTAEPTTTTLKTAPKSECNKHLQIALNVGWPPEQMARLAVVLWRESRCSFGPVLNPNDPMTGSYGAAQINGFWCHPTKNNPQPWLQQRGIIKECIDLYGAETNLRAALAIWRNSGWVPWGYSD